MSGSIKGYSPLPGNVTLDRSPIHGMGMFATQDIASGHDFGITHVKDDRFDGGYIRTPFGGFINHSTGPNCEVVEDADTLRIRTTRLIKAGDELTLDYTPYYDKEELATYN